MKYTIFLFLKDGIGEYKMCSKSEMKFTMLDQIKMFHKGK